MKYILACLWLLCYFPFVNSFVSDQNMMVVLYLENLQGFENESTYQTWDNCLSFLDENQIDCCIELECHVSNDDCRFVQWISMLEDRGHKILHAPACICARPVLMSFSRPKIEEAKNILVNDTSLSICASPESFKNQFKSQSRKKEILFVNGDPSSWDQRQYSHFKNNIEYLIKLGIRFDTPGNISLR